MGRIVIPGWLRKVAAAYLAVSAAMAAILLGFAVSDDLSAGFRRAFDSAMGISVWIALIFLMVFAFLSAGIVIVVVMEVVAVYKKWADRAIVSLENDSPKQGSQ